MARGDSTLVSHHSPAYPTIANFRTSMRTNLTIVAIALAVASSNLFAAELSDIKISDNDNGDSPTTLFTNDTPKIFVAAALTDVAGGETISAVWIAEKTDAAPPNHKIDSANVTAKEDMHVATFSLSKPNAGWPVGSYRVDLSVDGKPMISAHFKIATKL